VTAPACAACNRLTALVVAAAVSARKVGASPQHSPHAADAAVLRLHRATADWETHLLGDHDQLPRIALSAFA
jgi:hypothetical protein